MNTIKENEQWKLDGHCPLCRRQKYCTDECAASQRTYDEQLGRLIMEGLIKGFKRSENTKNEIL